MDTTTHNLNGLFAQLGLPDSDAEIEQFIEAHRQRLSPTQRLDEAPFWTRGQIAFLREAREEDADWSEVVDLLDTLLREHQSH